MISSQLSGSYLVKKTKKKKEEKNQPKPSLYGNISTDIHIWVIALYSRTYWFSFLMLLPEEWAPLFPSSQYGDISKTGSFPIREVLRRPKAGWLSDLSSAPFLTTGKKWTEIVAENELSPFLFHSSSKEYFTITLENMVWNPPALACRGFPPQSHLNPHFCTLDWFAPVWFALSVKVEVRKQGLSISPWTPPLGFSDFLEEKPLYCSSTPTTGLLES